jgi:NhaA family Na+:H+ antiporter
MATSVIRNGGHDARVGRFVRPFQEFAHNQASGGILLLLCTVVALGWANSGWADMYNALWHTPVRVAVGSFLFDHDLHFVVNDALMAVFFFVVGLEIKRELLAGELASPRQAALPILQRWWRGRACRPVHGVERRRRRGRRVGNPNGHGHCVCNRSARTVGRSSAARVEGVSTALAIVDDLAAVLVISVFYTSELHVAALAAAAVCIAVLFGINRMGFRSPLPYAVIGLVLWFAVLESGVHATIAGVMLAFTVPSAVAIDCDSFPGAGA